MIRTKLVCSRRAQIGLRWIFIFAVFSANSITKVAAQAKPADGDVVIAEPLPFKTGAPLSTRGLVARPAPIRGLISWSIETRRHRGSVYTSAVSPDGHFVATGGIDGTIRIWDLETGKFSRAMVGHNNYVFAIVWSPNGKYLASAGAYDLTARIWNAETGKLLRTIKHAPYVHRVVWSTDGSRLMIGGGESGQTIVTEAASNAEQGKLNFGERVLSTAWSPDGRTIAMGVRGQAVHLVDATTLKVRASVGEAPYDAVALSWSPDNQYLAVATPTKGTIIWNTLENKTEQSLPAATAVAWSPDGSSLALTPRGGPIEIWDPLANMNLEKLPHTASAMTWSSDGATLTTHFIEQITVWDIASKKARQAVNVGGSSPSVVWLSGKYLCSGIGTDTVHLSTVAGAHIRELKGTGNINTVALSPNGKVLAVGGSDKSIQIYEIATGKLLSTLVGHAASVTSVAWCSNGKTLASCSADKSVRIWDAPTGKLEHTLEGHTAPIDAVGWSARTVASAGADSHAILWNATSGQKIRSLELKVRVESLAWSDDGKLLATGDHGSNVTLWNITTGASMARWERPGSPPAVTALAWSPKLPILAAGRANHTIQLWDTRKGKVTHDLAAIAPVNSLAWAGGGGVVIAGTDDRCLRCWDASDARLLATIIADPKQLTIVNADGHYRIQSEDDCDLVFVAQTEHGQQTYSTREFSSKFNWKNSPQTKFAAQ